MRRWTRVGLAITATLAGMVALTPAAYAGTGFSAPKAERTTAIDTKTTDSTATNPFDELLPDLLSCIAAQTDAFDQVNFSRVCKQWNTAAHQPPAALQNLRVAHTQAELEAALDNAQVNDIVIVPHERITIRKAPVNPHARITIYAKKPQHQYWVEVQADINVTATGIAKVNAYGSAHVTARGGAEVNAFDSTHVTATTYAFAKAYNSTQVIASDNATVFVFSADSEVIVLSSSVHLRTGTNTQAAVHLIAGVRPYSLQYLPRNLQNMMNDAQLDRDANPDDSLMKRLDTWSKQKY